MSKNIEPINDKGQRHGYWEYYHPNGTLMYKGNYVNGNRYDYWESYYGNDKLEFKGNFFNGNRHGYWESYCSNGDLFYKGNYDMGKVVNYEVNVDSSPKEMFPIY